jgi:hypothetical protein
MQGAGVKTISIQPPVPAAQPKNAQVPAEHPIQPFLLELAEIIEATILSILQKQQPGEGGKQGVVAEKRATDGEKTATQAGGLVQTSKNETDEEKDTKKEKQEWEVLIELRDATGYQRKKGAIIPGTDWTDNKEGWDKLESHRDPSRCSGVTTDCWGRVTGINLPDTNLRGGECAVSNRE